MMYNIGPNILLFITHYIKIIIYGVILISIHIYLKLYIYIYIYIYIYLWFCVLQLFLKNFVFNANLRIPKY
jgi:hypothetical protein